MAMKSALCVTFVLWASASVQARAGDACEVPELSPAQGRALLQVKKETFPHEAEKADGNNLIQALDDNGRQCSWHLVENQDGSQPCSHLQKDKSYTPGSGSTAALDEAGYQQIAALCCHHEMSLFVRREIAKQGFDVCNLSDLHGFIHWFDCSRADGNRYGGKDGNDLKNFAEMQTGIANVMSSHHCPWLGHLPNCPAQGRNCHDFPPCPDKLPAGAMSGSIAPLDGPGYTAVALGCCHTEIEEFVRREIARQGFQVCDEGDLQGFLKWYDCPDEKQTYESLVEGIKMARSGLPPLCPWIGSIDEACPPRGHNCPVVELPEPAAHRRRTACR